MPDFSYTNAINTAGRTEQSIAASGAMILNQMDRDLIKERVGDTPRSGAFLSQIRGLMDKLTKVDNYSEARNSSGMGTQEKDLEILDRQNKIQRRLIRLAPTTLPERERTSVTSSDQDAQEDSLGAEEDIDIQMLKAYAIAYAGQLLQSTGPKLKLDTYTQSLRIKIVTGVRENIEKSVEQKLYQQLGQRIRSYLLKQLENPVDFLRALFKVQKPSQLLSLVVPPTLEQTPTESPLVSLEQFGPPHAHYQLFELVLLYRNLGLDIHEILADWSMEKVTIDSLATLDLLDGSTEIRDKSELLVSYRNLWIAYWMEESILKRMGGNLQLRQLRNEIRRHGARDAELTVMEKEARKIAWLQSVAELKELHLRRVFCGTEREFKKHSDKITWFTRRARYLGKPISPDGLKWVEARLEVLALQAAQYKVNLLTSMQKLSFEKSRERDIQWLTKTIDVLKKRLPSQKSIQEAELALA